MPTVFEAANAIKGRRESIKGKVDKATKKGPKKPTPAPKKGGVTAAQAKRSERKGKSGERAFGTPMQGSAFDNQSTDSNQ
jgi:hypothetical protein